MCKENISFVARKNLTFLKKCGKTSLTDYDY